MPSAQAAVDDLRAEVAALRAELQHTQDKLNALECSQKKQATIAGASQSGSHPTASWEGTDHTMSKDEVERYSRQILLHSFGPQAQDRLCKGSVLIIGAGGLGCPAAIYLAAAGVGKIGIVDKDVVDLSNLHRQILHSESKVGRHKADSAAEACRAVNSLIKVVAYRDGFHPGNALDLIQGYDVIVDASDNAPTRYLISDACCVLFKPLVSGAAIGTDGQLNVYCHNDGPCYRCLFPVPPEAANCSRCSDAGVLGPVPGLIGVLQAIEAIKLVSGVGSVSSQKMLMVDTLSGRFTSVKLRSKQPNCVACGSLPSITADSLAAFDYKAFTGQDYHDGPPESLNLLPPQQRITPKGFAQSRDMASLLDVRPQLQFKAAHIPGSFNIPYDETHPDRFERAVGESDIHGGPLWVVCRRGNDSQRAAALLYERFGTEAIDIVGGLQSWSEYDQSFPLV